jgi:CRISPR-associated protein Csb2
MLSISVDLLHGTIRADSAENVALSGAQPSGEWPPSPARLFSALVAGDGTRDRCRVTDGSELLTLEGAVPSRIHADPRAQVLVSPLQERYVVVDERHAQTTQNYPARQARPVRAGVRLAPATPRIVYVWDELSPPEPIVESLTARAARVGYFGCADSPVRMRVATSDITAEAPPSVWTMDEAGSTTLPVPYPGFLDVLDDAYDRFTSGELVRRAWLPTRLARYRAPDDQHPAMEDRPTVLSVRLNPAVSGRKVLAVTETLRAAVLEGYQRHVAGSAGAVPQVLHGHGIRGDGYEHARWLALPDVGFAHSRGKIYGAAVWLPPGTAPEVIEGVRTTILRLHELVRPGRFKAKVQAFEGEARPLAANPDRWRGPSRRWVSAFPVMHERWQPGGPDLREVGRWCRHAGLPTPLGFRSVTVPLLRGAVSLRPHEVRRKDREVRPFTHVRLAFDEPVTGPVVIGRARQFGLGLMAPLDRWRGEWD